MKNIEMTTLEVHKEVFQKLTHFTAPAALGRSDLPQAILDNLVEHTLFLENKPLQPSQIVNAIKLHFKLSFEIFEVKESLNRLSIKEIVIKINGNFYIEVKHYSELKKVIKEKNEQEKNIKSKLIETIRFKYPKLTDPQINQIGIDFQKFLIFFFLSAGAEAVQLIYGNPFEVQGLINKIRKKNLFDLSGQTSLDLKEIEQKEFSNLVNILSEQDKIYLQDLLDQSLQYFTITVDKKCEALLTSDFKNWKLFVDTNFIYGLIGLEGLRFKKNAEQILDLGKKAGINFFVSPLTLEEFSNSVSRAREILLGNKISDELYKIASDLTGSAIIRAYYETRKEHNINPRDFLVKIENVKEILSVYGISEETEYYKSIKQKAEYSEIVTKLIALTHKEQHIAEHDAFIYLLILKLRSREGADNTFHTNKTWFLTHDSLLAPFDYEIRKKEIPFCIRPFQLRQILRPLFSRVDDFDAVYMDFVTNPSSRAFSKISADIAMKVLARVTYYEKSFNVKDSPELATKLLTSQHFTNELHKLRNEDKGLTELIDQEIKKIAEISETTIENNVLKDHPKNNYWNYFNPFWLIWHFIKLIINLIKKYKIISIITTIAFFIGLIAVDYSLAWKNIIAIYNFLKGLFY